MMLMTPFFSPSPIWRRGKRMVCHHSFPPPPLGEVEKNGVTGLTSPMPASHLTPPLTESKRGQVVMMDGQLHSFFLLPGILKNDFQQSPDTVDQREPQRGRQRQFLNMVGVLTLQEQVYTCVCVHVYVENLKKSLGVEIGIYEEYDGYVYMYISMYMYIYIYIEMVQVEN